MRFRKVNVPCIRKLGSVSANALVSMLNDLKNRISYKGNFKVDFDMDPYDFT